MKAVLWYKSAVLNKVLKHKINSVGEDEFYKSEHFYAGQKIGKVKDTSKQLESLIKSGRPMMAARYGLTELFVMRSFVCDMTSKMNTSIKQLEKWSGFFPATIGGGRKFTKLMIEDSMLVDYLATNFQPMEDYFIKKYMPKEVILAEFRGFEPWYENTAWTSALKGKKVLVIHPFSETIQSQYAKRDLLFSNKEMLPEFELITIKAVQTSAGEKDNRFGTWFDALDYMYQETKKYEFDIALLGCGAYGFPLAARLKRDGKQAIHMGGMLQILFGIKGKRWDEDRIVGPLYNESWVRPNDVEKPKNSNIVEGGCYW